MWAALIALLGSLQKIPTMCVLLKSYEEVIFYYTSFSLLCAVCSAKGAVLGLQYAVCSAKGAVLGLQYVVCSAKGAVLGLQYVVCSLQCAVLRF